MHSFAVVATRPERQLSPDLVNLLDHPDLPDLPFVADQHLHWADASGRVHFAGWQAYTDVLQLGSHWHTDDRGLVAFSGHPWPRGGAWRSDSTWASQLRQIWGSAPITSGDERFGGIYSALSIDRDGVGSVMTDPLSLAVLYRAENDDVTVISNNARLAATMAAAGGAAPDRDPMAAAWLVHFGYMVGPATTFAGTTVIPSGSFVEVGPLFGCRIADRTGAPWSAPDRADLSFDEWVDLIHDDFRAGIRSVAELPAPELLADITGGRDSRLVLSLMVEQGVQDRFKFRTTGAEHTPDSQVGALIAADLGLDHEPMRPAPMDGTDFHNRLRTHVFQTSGMLNPWDFKGALGVARRPKVSGLLGEAIRTTPPPLPPLRTDDQLWTEFRKAMRLDQPSVLRPEVREVLDAALHAELFDQDRTGGTAPLDRQFSFYVRNRLRRWVGTQEELGEACRVFPLYSLVGVQAGFALGADARRSDRIAFEVMRRADPKLAQTPFADHGWSEELINRLPDADAYRAQPIKPAKPAKGAAAPVQWQRSRIDDNQNVVREYLLDERSGPIHDLIDRRRIEAILDGEPGVGSRAHQQLFGAISAAIWLGGDELTARYGHDSYDVAHLRGRAPAPGRVSTPTPPSSSPGSTASPDHSSSSVSGNGSGSGNGNGKAQLRGLARKIRLTTARRLHDAARRIAG